MIAKSLKRRGAAANEDIMREACLPQEKSPCFKAASTFVDDDPYYSKFTSPSLQLNECDDEEVFSLESRNSKKKVRRTLIG